MTIDQHLYSELKNDFRIVSDPLFKFAEEHVRKHGAYLPFGAVLSRSGEVTLQAAATNSDLATSEEILPLLVEGLQLAVDAETTAAAVAEWVKIGVNGSNLVDAMKVQIHHRRGLSIAFYVPATKQLLKGWQFGETVVQPATSLIAAWV